MIPGFGGHKRLTDRIGKAAAKELLYTGRMIEAKEALRLGIVNRICEPEALIDEVIALSEEMSKTSPHAVSQAKQLLNLASDRDMETFAAEETERFGEIFFHDDAIAGRQAFLNKSKPQWSNA
jgi:enoyl-CoA hydratase